MRNEREMLWVGYKTGLLYPTLCRPDFVIYNFKKKDSLPYEGMFWNDSSKSFVEVLIIVLATFS